jgi:hypothetical protein
MSNLSHTERAVVKYLLRTQGVDASSVGLYLGVSVHTAEHTLETMHDKCLVTRRAKDGLWVLRDEGFKLVDRK